MELSSYQPHWLHTAERHWPETNCYIDLWIELLHAKGLDPVAALGFTVAQDYEGDHFTFSKYPTEDLELLYGLAVQELAVYDRLEVHLAEQARRGRTTLVEVDGWYLPDTRGLTYHIGHGKTTIGVHRIDPAAKRLEYFHSSGLHSLDGDDYDGVLPPRTTQDEILPPYVEFVRERSQQLEGDALTTAALDRFRLHRSRRPAVNPITQWRTEFDDQLRELLDRPAEFFHQYAFNFCRQLGMNWELHGSFLQWIDARTPLNLTAAIAVSTDIAEMAKTLQFRMARLISRRKFDPCSELLEALERRYDELQTFVDQI